MRDADIQPLLIPGVQFWTMAKLQNLTRYQTIQMHAANRREGMQKSLAQSDAVRAAMAGNIAKSASNQVVLSEQLLRARMAATAKAKIAALNKLV